MLGLEVEKLTPKEMISENNTSKYMGAGDEMGSCLALSRRRAGD